MLHRLSISKRITLLALISILIFASGMVLEAFHKRDDLLAAKKDRLMQLVEAAHNIIVDVHRRQLEGQLSQIDAQNLAKEVIRSMRYDGDNYFWINDMRPFAVMHPVSSRLEGHSVAEVVDQQGVYLFRDFVRVVREQGQGFVSYQWPRPSASQLNDYQELPKLSYVMGFEPWGWIVGTGVFVDDIDQQFRTELGQRLLITVAMLALLVALSLYIGVSIIKPLRRTASAMNRATSAHNDLSVRMPVEGKNELSELASGFNSFADKVASITDALLRKEARLKEAQKLAHVGDWEWNLTTGKLHWSKQACSILGYQPDQVNSDIQQLRQRITQDGRIEFEKTLARIKSGQECDSVFQLQRDDESFFYIRLRGRLSIDSSEHAAIVIGSIQDVTLELELRGLLEDKERLYRQMFENNSAIKLLIDPDNGRIVDANAAALEYYGYSLEQLGELLISDINILSQSEVNDRMQSAVKNEEKFFSFQHRLSSGEIRDVEVYSGPVSLKDKNYLHSIVFDVTERNQLQQQLQNAAMRDSLTDLYNRRAIDIEGERSFMAAKRNNTELSVIMIDIDHFKKVNDRFGHPVGDIVLKAVSSEIAELARGSDVLGRYGGEEFILLAPASDLPGVRALAERILSKIRACEVIVQGQAVGVTVSAGVAVMAAEDRSIYDVIARADEKLYEAKQSGRDRACG
ncbi:MAG: diguanylate cyclase [Motiliproteus sp.]|nr:diguanylate cyclase [Motiliproteus sp.]MCW9052229.1 diguanylate cyclase [Motiliproteus sp.]